VNAHLLLLGESRIAIAAFERLLAPIECLWHGVAWLLLPRSLQGGRVRGIGTGPLLRRGYGRKRWRLLLR